VKRFSETEKQTIWDMREAGVPVKRIARHLGRQNVSLRKFIADAGGRRPTPRERSDLRLSLVEREEISRGLAAGHSLRAIATTLGRSPSTPRGRRQRRAIEVPGPSSPTERPAGERFDPNRPSSHSAGSSRGALRKELHSCLRSGRAMRRAKAYVRTNHIGQGQLRNMVMISERPAEVRDRAVPGHWEGELPPLWRTSNVRRREVPLGRMSLCQCAIQTSFAREQREHQRPPSAVPAQVSRSLPMLPARARGHRSITQHQASTDPRLDDTISGVRRGCCVNRPRPQLFGCILSWVLVLLGSPRPR
jgi:Helix-turn-helix domain